MCGISGIYARTTTPQQAAMIDAMLLHQHPRGPDHHAMAKLSAPCAEAIFGHNRLSIIDLSEAGNQPMWDVTGRYCITYNGEIYNYIELREELRHAGLSFRTEGDTEVILNALAFWGTAALSRLNGPFAFALFDRKTGQLGLYRDRFGVRPLYYHHTDTGIYFASSASVLAKALGLQPNLDYVAGGLKYLVYENDSNTSPYSGIVSLPAGQYLLANTCSSGRVMAGLERYYDLTERIDALTDTLPLHSMPALIERVDEVLQDAVRIRMRSDVPLGISLSSGLDSSTVAALVRERHDETVGFSYGHPLDKKTEGALVAKCARFLGLKMVYVSPSPEALTEGLFQTLQAQEAPFSSLSMVAQYLLYQQIHASGVKVILGGQGGDEAFMGYRKFIFFWLQTLRREKKYLTTFKNLLQFMPMFLAELSAFSTYWKHRHRYFQTTRPVCHLLLPESPRVALSMGGDLRERQVQDITRFSLPTLLRYEDRNAMANSVESRLPFLDYRLVELGVALPAAIKIRAGYGKWPLRQIMHQKIPDRIRLAHYKRGFDIPLRAMLRTGFGKVLRARLSDNREVNAQYLKSGVKISVAFSDQQLLKRTGAMTEAITLLWLNRFFI